MANAGWLGRGARCAVAGIIVAFSHVTVSGIALAQQPPAKAPPAKAPAAPAAPPAKGAPPAAQGQPPAGGQQSAWVKLCESADLVRRDKDGKDVKETKNICLTHHERLDGNTRMVLVSAAIRDVEGVETPHPMVMVPPGQAIPPGLRAAVYPKDLWEKAQKNEKVEEKLLEPIDLKYSLCHPAGCTAEVEASKELVESMKTGGGFLGLAGNAAAQPLAFPGPLDGVCVA